MITNDLSDPLKEVKDPMLDPRQDAEVAEVAEAIVPVEVEDIEPTKQVEVAEEDIEPTKQVEVAEEDIEPTKQVDDQKERILPVDSTFERKKLSCHYDIKRISELNPSQKERLNHIMNVAFDQGAVDYLTSFDDQSIISYAYDSEALWGIAMSEIKTYDADPNHAYPTLIHLHSIAVHPEARGNGLCKGLVNRLKIYYHKEHPSCPLYLNVRISKNDPNIGGMKCYKKQGFRVVPVPPLERSDGPNFYMVCEPKKRSKKKRTQKKRSKKKRTQKKK